MHSLFEIFICGFFFFSRWKLYRYCYSIKGSFYIQVKSFISQSLVLSVAFLPQPRADSLWGPLLLTNSMEHSLLACETSTHPTLTVYCLFSLSKHREVMYVIYNKDFSLQCMCLLLMARIPCGGLIFSVVGSRVRIH